MPGIDPLAFIIISAAFGTLCAFVLFVLGSGFLRDIKGLAHWGAACITMATAAFLFALRGIVPVLFSSFLPNLLVAVGVVTMHASLTEYGGFKRKTKLLFLILGAAALALAWFTFVQDNYRARVITMSSTLTVLFTACALLIFRLKEKGFAERFTGLAFLATSVVMLARCTAAFLQNSRVRPDTDTSLVHSVYMGTFAFSLVALSLGFMLMVSRAMHMKLEFLATRDQMTGVYRRDAFLALLDQTIAQSRLKRRPMSVLIIDLDNFKEVNDRHGHLTGDQVIIDFSSKVQQLLRRGDAIGRYGGEEFLVLLPDTTQDDAYSVADRIRAMAAEVWSKEVPAYTVSIGVAPLVADYPDSATLIDAADKALYAAKKAGKNHVMLACSQSYGITPS
ncbi:GGDEF domain-containing protein [Noviherbaspirillum sp. CPCC 100848]|uniref:diguanylate cyclase n=1 Tax=Noviherbaspirillum album TaxID=3080276 RepID=A0ABU6JGX0_9BURK|nr:GGDEF domain-containing protein [Noviherbaspirillum sp. CPCC 100848]MEC4722897.1 GGDEF domain-containing protein [Noviherbaspirillum sp. CPCC 100848]